MVRFYVTYDYGFSNLFEVGFKFYFFLFNSNTAFSYKRPFIRRTNINLEYNDKPY